MEIVTEYASSSESNNNPTDSVQLNATEKIPGIDTTTKADITSTSENQSQSEDVNTTERQYSTQAPDELPSTFNWWSLFDFPNVSPVYNDTILIVGGFPLELYSQLSF